MSRIKNNNQDATFKKEQTPSKWSIRLELLSCMLIVAFSYTPSAVVCKTLL